ncbi:MAG: type II toxin-antitoxin system prevent-host-death family antitoxin [Chloroflexota bacterium]|nr:MAG: type II toxin-antitoxin system prevent-host-death family antitoxin [Chloroflexota bacterium]
MRQVGIRELKNDASALVRSVREEGESINVTYHGRVVARLVPATPEVSPRLVPPPMSAEERKRAMDEWWSGMQALGERITERWPEGISAVDAVRDVRREL